MVKARDLKLIRKKLAKTDRIQDPLELIRSTNGLPSSSPVMGFASHSSQKGGDNDSESLSLDYRTSAELSQELKDELLSLFERNMGEMYRNSSWGLDLEQKEEELSHSRARFFLVYSKGQLAAFVHFRFCYDDDQDPRAVVLYLYEIQIEAAYQRQGLGKRLMSVLEALIVAAGLDTNKVMLTCFKKNSAAMQFYTSHLGYHVDQSSPSQCGEYEDYEILSKTIDPERVGYL
jgi:N-alpha-acetyltransferase 40